MTLLELLVKELPKCGGWPEGATVAVQDGYKRCVVPGKVKFAGTGCAIRFRGDNWSGVWRYPGFRDFKASYLATDYEVAVVSRDQYEAALTQRQPVESWNGEGLPPVGCLVDVQMYRGCGSDCNLEWYSEKVLGRDGDIIIVASGCRAGDYEGVKPHSYRPPRTETDKKRDEAVRVLIEVFEAGVSATDDARNIYDAIAEGKIPGVKLED